MINIKENEKLSIMNHSCAHLLAQAVKHLYPEAKFWVGPVIEEGFYYDIDLGDKTLTDEELPKIEREMKKIAKIKLNFCLIHWQRTFPLRFYYTNMQKEFVFCHNICMYTAWETPILYLPAKTCGLTGR